MSDKTLTVIIPARNEESNIKECLDSLIQQSYKNLDIIVVNDQSEDKTPEIVKEFQRTYPFIRLIDIKEKPVEWVGKSYALYSGYLESVSPLLLFMDADVRLNKLCIERTLETISNENLDILSYAAFQQCQTIIEYAIQPLVFYFLNIFYPLDGINTNSSGVVACNGIFILIKRELYEQIGTHSAIKSEILEDVELAKRIQSQGGRIKFMFAPDLITVRMYKNIKEIYEGWSKNFFVLLQRSCFKSIELIMVLMLLFWLPLTILIFNISLYLLILPILMLNITYFCYAYSKMGYKLWVGLLFPLGSVLLSIIIINSLVNYKFKGRVIWKNRMYKVK